MGNNRVYSFLGIATKAGVTVSGHEKCEKIIKTGKAKLVIIAKNASENTKKEFEAICKTNGVSYIYYGDKEDLGKYCGKDERAVVAVCDVNFATRLKEIIEAEEVKESGGGA